jgi:hypothetical protein
MNSTSAAAFGGRAARVDGGRILVGAPGGPGCTTTGGEVVCCPYAVIGKMADRPAARNAHPRKVRRNRIFGIRLEHTGTGEADVKGKIFIQTGKQFFHETENCSTWGQRGKHYKNIGELLKFPESKVQLVLSPRSSASMKAGQCEEERQRLQLQTMPYLSFRWFHQMC